VRIAVSSYTVEGTATIVRPSQAAYTTRVCSVCGSDDESVLLTQVTSGERASLESAFCRRCEHAYLRRLPSIEWYEWYYKQAWDTGGGPHSQSLAARARYTAGRLRLAARRRGRPASAFVSGVAGDAQAMQIFPMLLGVVEDSTSYRADTGIRSVLEVGAGYGGLLAKFHRRGFRAVGTEASPRRAAACRERGLDVVDSPVDSVAGVEHAAPFDLAYSLQVLEHLADPRAHLEALAGLIRPDGYLFLQLPHVRDETNVLHRAHSAVHCDGYSPRSLVSLLRRCGFVPIRLQIDNNLHVLARRSEPSPAALGGLDEYRDTASPEQLLALLEVAAGERGRLRAEWDHALVEIRRYDDGELVFKRQVHYNVELQAQRSRLVFEVDGDRDVSWPVRFEHPGDDPPIYTKQS
jgi:2-polyprenyl-3-methyl-5-hydroxy-6-metoxy-1,4-benzoquinol methylase